MRTSPLTDVYDRWSRPSYEIRVRGTAIAPTFLWGSAGLSENIHFSRPLLLHLRNDLFGEDITFGTQVAAGTQTTIGTLKPGECVSIPVQDISGVFAICTIESLESVVACLIRS